MVTLQCGSTDSACAIASAVRSCRRRCQKWVYCRRGTSTLTSVSPSASAVATTSAAARGMRRSGHSTMSSGSRAKPEVAPRARQVLGLDRVEVEVDGPQVVGSRARARTGWRGPRPASSWSIEHDHGVAAQDRRLGRARRVLLELLELVLVLPVQAHERARP